MDIHKTLLLMAVLALILMPMSCRKESVEEKLATSRNVITAIAEGGKQTVEVYASGVWTAEFAESTDWVKLESKSGNGDGELVLEFVPNDGLYRFTTLTLSLSGSALRLEIEVNQESVKGSPVLNLFPPDMVYPAAEGNYEILYSANVPQSQLSVECGRQWVRNLEVLEKAVKFSLEPNPEESRRTAEIWLVCTDAQGKTYKTRCNIMQEAKGDKMGFDREAGNDGYIVDDDKYKW